MSSYEIYFTTILKKSQISWQKEKTFKDLKHGLFRFDFYINEYCGRPIIIEIDGEQHFKPIYGRQKFLKGQEHDRRKNSYCLANDIELYRIPYWEVKKINSLEDVIQDKYRVKDRWHNDKLTPPR